MNNGARFLFMVYFASISTFLVSCAKSTDSDSTELFGNWKRSSEFEGYGRTEAVSFSIGDRIFVGGGYDGTDRLQDFWELDASTGTWYKKADFPGVARNSAVAFSINGKGYVGTGYDGTKKLNDFWEYDPSSNSWKQIADFAGTARYGAVGFSIQDKGYVATGYDGNYLKDLWEYDPSTNTWTQKTSLSGSKRTDAVVFVHDNKAFIVTGVNNGSYLNDFWMYDPATNSWTEKRKITDVSDETYDDDYDSYITRSNASIFILNNKAYLTTGNRSGVISSTWEYDISTDLWKERTAFEGTSREGAIGFSSLGRGFITTGKNTSNYFDDMLEFFPGAEQNDNDN